MTEVYDYASDDTALGQPAKAALMIAAVAVGLAMVSAAVLTAPAKVETVDPETVRVSGEFAQANLGTRVAANGHVTVRIVATPSAFSPSCVVVPAGRQVDLRLASASGLHSVTITGSAVHAMVAPGAVSHLSTVFKAPGDQLMSCDAICGMGPRRMAGMVRVVAPEQFRPGPDGLASCSGA